MKITHTWRYFYFCFIFFLNEYSFARTEPVPTSNPAQIGNFALPPSQQVFPLISFGQAIIGENVVQLTVPFNATLGTQNNYSFVSAFSALWGITNYLSLTATVPVSYKNRSQNNFSSGLNDTTFQLEGAIYQYSQSNYGVLITLVGNITAPTGSASKNPSTGLGAPSFFAGTTISYLATRWYAFTSYAGIFPLAGRNFQGGNQVLYQAGFGRNIPTNAKTIFDWLVEFDGTYTWRNKVNGSRDSNSGGNVIYVTPSLYFATRYWIVQFGVGYPFVQVLNGNQSKDYLSVTLAVTYTIG